MGKQEVLLKAKIPGEETGIEIKHTVCDICCPFPHCGIDAYVKDGVLLKVEGSQTHPANSGSLCAKGAANRAYIYHEDRLKTPMKRVGARGEGTLEPITWAEAYTEIAQKLGAAKAQYGAQSVAFFSGYTKWYRPFLKRFAFSFGSPNYGTESSVCFSASKMAWLLGSGEKATPDFFGTKLFVGWAFNPYYSRHRMENLVNGIKERGGKVLTIDPIDSLAGERMSDLHLRPRPGTDGALALGFAKWLIDHQKIDLEYIENHVHGFSEYEAYVQEFTPERVEVLTGVPAAEVIAAATMIGEAESFVINESNAAVTHHFNGVQNYRAIMALLAITGNYDHRGGQLVSRDSYNYQGAGFVTREPEFISKARLKTEYEPVGTPRFPVWHDTVGEMQACDLARQIFEGTPYPVKTVFALGYNHKMFADSNYQLDSLKELDFFVNVDLFMTEACKYADIVLPACSSFERSELKAYTGGFAQLTKPVISPLYESKSDAVILCELAKIMGLEDALLTAGYEACLEFILSNLPNAYERLKNTDEPVKIPEAGRYMPGSYTKEGYKTPTGKFELYSTIIAKYKDSHGLDPLPTYVAPRTEALYPMNLCSGIRVPGAIHSRFHRVAWTRSLRPQATADISLADAKHLGIKPMEDIEIYNNLGCICVKANPTSRVLEGVVNLFHGYDEADVNTLVDRNYLDPYSGFPAYKSIMCNIRRV